MGEMNIFSLETDQLNEYFFFSLPNLLTLIIHNDLGGNLWISDTGSAVTHLLLKASKENGCSKISFYV